MATGYLLPIGALYQSFSDQGIVGAGFQIYTYVGGTVSSPVTTYTDATLAVPNSNPIVLTASGRFQNVNCWVPAGTLVKIVLTDAGNNPIDGGTIDNLPGINDLSLAIAFFAITSGEIAAGVTPVNYGYPPGDVRRYGAVGDGLTPATSAFQNAANSNSACFVPDGTWLITNVTIANNYVSFTGQGWNTILKVGASSSTLFTVTGQGFQCSRFQWLGDGTSSNSTNGVAVFLNGAGQAVFQDNYANGFGFGAISGVAASALVGPNIVRLKCRSTAAGGNEVYLGGLWVETVIEDPDFYSATADRCLLMYDNSTSGWSDVRVRGGTSRGYLKQQWATTDENWDGSNRVWDVIFDGLSCNASNWSAIKCKTSRGVKVINCTFDGCGLAQEDQPSGLYGDVLCNSLGNVLVADNIFRNSGSTAIRCVAPGVSQYPGTDPGGKADHEWIVTGNQIDATGVVFSSYGDGIAILNGFKQALITDNVMRGITLHAVNALQTANTPFFDLGILNNTVGDSPSMTNTGAWNIGFGQNLRMNGNAVQNCGATGAVITDVQYVIIGAQDSVLDPAASGGRGYQVGNAQDLDFRASCGNSTYASWLALTPYVIGNRVFNGANVYECVVAGTSGNTGGPVNTSGASTEGTVTWFFIGKYQLMPYAIRLVGTQVKVNLDFDANGCVTGPIEGLIMGSGGTRIHYTTSVATANATPTNAQVIPIPDLSAWMCQVKAVAQAAAVPDRAAYNRVGLFYRNGGGTTLQGAVTSVVNIESNAAWECLPAASGNNLAPAQVTGAAATSVNWAIEITMLGMP
jgi:Pectate lyase superfamily protein